MLGYASAVGICLRTIKKTNILYSQHQRGWATSSRLYASDGRKKGFIAPEESLRRNGFPIKSSNNAVPQPPAATSKLVQIRSNATGAVPPPPLSPPAEPPGPPSPDKSASLRNLLIGFIIAAASLGGVYYSGILEGGEEIKKKVDLASKINDKKGKGRPVKRYPALQSEFPRKVPYVLIGGGTASFAAFRAIKSKDPTAKVLVISAEDSLPYMRPPLSKEIWQQNELPPIDKLTFKQWNGQERNLYYEPCDFYTAITELESSPNGGVAVATGWVVSSVDAAANMLQIEDPATGTHFPVQYDKCLIATGSCPKNLEVFERAGEGVKQRTVLYRNVRDLEALWSSLQAARSVAIVGGGFLGSELACSLARKYKDKSGPQVYQMFKESGNMGRVLPEYLSQWTTERVKEEGVNVIPDAEVLEADFFRNQVMLTLSNGSSVKADVVVVAVGSDPCTQLAETSSLETDPLVGGFLVNAELEARTNLYVAGDAACFYDPALGRRRVEHHDHAVISGRLAGENMAGGAAAYKHQSMFWSDLGPDVGYEAIGIVDACLPTVAVFAKNDPEKEKPVEIANQSEEKKVSQIAEDPKPRLTVVNPDLKKIEESPKKTDDKAAASKAAKDEYNKGIIFYLKKDRVVGIVLWNTFNRMHIARQVLAERRKYEDLNEVAKLFNLHED